ncbi:MAG: hypothetical protein IJT99_04645 [Clostridia bacterium]|nr:hypothetical protein [Clostridia bacterium]
MATYIALDGGGTKTLTVVFEETGHILYRSHTAGSNPLDIGPDASRQLLLGALRDAAAHASVPLDAVYCGAAGIVYYSNFFECNMCAELSSRHFVCEGDVRNMISSELYHNEDGCCLIIGTGCGLWQRRQGKMLGHTGGWGYLVDTYGSGFWLGREAVRAVARDCDKRGPNTLLTELLCKETGDSFPASLPGLYAGGRARFASLAHLVFTGEEAGDTVCRRLIADGADYLAELVRTASSSFDGPFPVVVGGGIATAYPRYVRMIKELSPPTARFLSTSAPPIFGAATEAMHMDGRIVTQKFRKRFLDEWNALSE